MQTITFYNNNKGLWRAGLHSGHGSVPEEGAREQKQRKLWRKKAMRKFKSRTFQAKETAKAQTLKRE